MDIGIAMMAAMMATTTPDAVPPEPPRLSEQQVAQVLADAAARREAIERPAPEPTRHVHGELGTSFGTGGHRGAFGTAIVPLGENGDAMLSFSTEKGRAGYGGGYDQRGPLRPVNR